MSYGILVKNIDGRVQMDENVTNVFPDPATEGSAIVGSEYPPIGISSSEMVAVRAKSDGHVAVGVNADPNTTYNGPAFMSTNNYYITRFEGPTSGFGYYVLKPYAGNVSPSITGTGFEIYNSSSQVVFSATESSINFKIVALGNYGTAAEEALPSATTTYPDLTKLYVLINATTHTRVYVPLYDLDYEEIIGYRYEFVSGNAGRIHICKKGGNGSNIGALPGGTSIQYLILERIP